jgi:hypothetical protein
MIRMLPMSVTGVSCNVVGELTIAIRMSVQERIVDLLGMNDEF